MDIITYPTIQDGQTALVQASIKGHHNVVEFLLGAGANPDLQDKVGKLIPGWELIGQIFTCRIQRWFARLCYSMFCLLRMARLPSYWLATVVILKW